MVHPDSVYQRIYATVRRIPRGRVASYGQIARLVRGSTPRMVGYAMAALPGASRVPWHRVVNHRGEVSPRAAGDGALVQKALLEREGLVFNRSGRLDMARFGWKVRGVVPRSEAKR